MTKKQRELIANIYKRHLRCKIHSDFIRFFGNAKVMRFINIIDSGSTIILLHRANKNGGHYQGSNDIRNSEMSKHKKGFTNEVKKMLNQNELLGWLEHKKDDKTTKGILDKFGNVFWSRYKEKNVWYYSTCPKIGTYDSISV